jgi:hypothetical protein
MGDVSAFPSCSRASAIRWGRREAAGEVKSVVSETPSTSPPSLRSGFPSYRFAAGGVKE